MIESIRNVLAQFEELNKTAKIYDKVRIVDPVSKKVYDVTKKCFAEDESDCFGVWQSKEICKNCISSKAVNDNETCVKIESDKKGVFMVTAVPVEISERKLSLEIIKNITKSFYVSDLVTEELIEIYELISRFNEVAVMDELTGIYNRRYINDRLPVEIMGCAVKKQPISLIMADIDRFKNVNDTYGHTAGDIVLKEFALALKECTRTGTDWVARFGGEEFIVCLPNAGQEKASEIAERMRIEISKKIVNYDSAEIKITSSFGVATLQSSDMITFGAFIEMADKHLYHAKKTGRNKVVSSIEKNIPLSEKN